MTDIRTPEQKVHDAQKQAEIEKQLKALAQAYMLTFGNEMGERVLDDLKDQGLVYEPYFGPRERDYPLDPIRLGALEGRRHIVLYIMALIEKGKRGG
ncbi:hypothetical protein LCGC14_0929400 [marine sediment metagenome]|uniref:Bbp19-like phage domain-containing protein n=1 Tax=marine sediment metagenome TaxID=412755 RepID=A0A0F9P9C1_9ZZZZ